MKSNNSTPLEIYINLVFKFIVIVYPLIALCAGLTFTLLYALGYYPDLKLATILCFDLSCVIYSVIGFIINRTCEGEDGSIKPLTLKIGKIFIAILEVVQWNFITYMIPSRDFWAYSFFFVFLAVSFLDSKYILIITGEISISMIVSWIIRPDAMLPVRDSLFIPEIALRVVLILLFFFVIWLFTATIERRLAKELEKLSDFDTLTLLYNRRKLKQYLRDAVAQKKNGKVFSVIMSDIDDFKKINDTYGHRCGDQVLKDVAAIMRDAVILNGLVFRYGGEEILLLLYTDQDTAASVAEVIRNRVAEHRTVYEDISVNVTLTFGVAECTETDTIETLINRADANLYYGKNHGKNCVIR